MHDDLLQAAGNPAPDSLRIDAAQPAASGPMEPGLLTPVGGVNVVHAVSVIP